jgi:aspartyl-tRNA(Asn)/glutamyl-tRNA(Gln) amidotransferase subunit C
MALNLDEVKKIATLARLRLSPEEEATFAGQLGKVVDYIDQLARYEPLAPEVPAGGERDAEDVVRPGLAREEFLANAPAARDGFLIVPDVIGGGGPEAAAVRAGATGPAGPAPAGARGQDHG